MTLLAARRYTSVKRLGAEFIESSEDEAFIGECKSGGREDETR